VYPLEWQNRYYQIASWDRDGRRIVIADGDEARIVDSTTGSEMSLRGHRQVKYAGFSADGARVLTAGGDSSAKLWDAATGKLVSSYPFQAVWVGAVAMSPDNQRIATIMGDHDIQIMDVNYGQLIAKLPGGSL